MWRVDEGIICIVNEVALFALIKRLRDQNIKLMAYFEYKSLNSHNIYFKKYTLKVMTI